MQDEFLGYRSKTLRFLCHYSTFRYFCIDRNNRNKAACQVNSPLRPLSRPIVVEAQAGEGGLNRWEEFRRRADILIEPFTAGQAHIATRAWSTYGKRKQSAGLNLGDCFSYTLAKALDEPLLFKGDDFSKTDIKPAIRS